MDFEMKMSFLPTTVRTLCAVGFTSFILSALAQAAPGAPGVSNCDGNGDQNRHNPHLSAVPEASAGWVLVPFAGAMLLLYTRRLRKSSRQGSIHQGSH